MHVESHRASGLVYLYAVAPLLASLAPEGHDASNINQDSRLKLYRMLTSLREKEAYWFILGQAWACGAMETAILLHDSPAEIRLAILDGMGEAKYSEIIELFTRIERHRRLNDPHGIYPSVVTGGLLSRLLATGWQDVCHLCERSFDKEGDDVVWKKCKAHLMHVRCFKHELRRGGMPLFGPCGCVEDVS